MLTNDYFIINKFNLYTISTNGVSIIFGYFYKSEQIWGECIHIGYGSDGGVNTDNVKRGPIFELVNK
jgi:hypothetical protein